MTDDTQTIKILDFIEHEDGSCTITMDITQSTAQLLIQVGFLKLLSDYSNKETENE